MKWFLTPLWVGTLVLAPLHADRVFSTFDPSTAGLNLKFDTNSLKTDNFFSPTIIFSPDGKSGFVNFPGSDSVVVFDTETMATIANLAVGKNPAEMAITPDQKTIVVANTHLADKVPLPKLTGSISLIDIATLAVKTVALGKVDLSLGSNVIFTPDSKTGFLSSTGTDEIVRFNVSSGAEITPRLKLPGGSRPVRLTRAHDGSFFTAVNVSDQQFSTIQDSVAIVEVSTFKVRASMTPKEPHDFLAAHRVALTLDDTKGIIGDDGNKSFLGVDVVYIFDTKTGEILKRKEVGINTFLTALTPDGSSFVVISEFGISILSTDTLEIAAEVIPPGGSFQGATNITFTQDAKTAYIVSAAAELFYRIDLQTYAVTALVPVGKDPKTFEDSPFFVALTPDEQRVAVLNFGSNTIDFVGKTFAFAAARFYADTTRFTGLALANVGPTSANVKLQALSIGGVAFQDDLQTTDRVEVVNPQTLDLLPGQQVVAVASELFQNDPMKDPINGWISIDSTQPDLIGFFEIGDASGSKLDGANLIKRGSTFAVLPVVRQNNQFSTELIILNPNFNSATVSVDLVGQDGTVVKSVSGITLPGLGVISRRLKSADSNLVDFLPEAADLQGAYLAVTATLPVGVLGVYETADELSVLPALAPPTTDVNQGVKLVAPLVSMLAGFKTVVSLVNVSGQDSEIRLTVVGNDGMPLTGTKVVLVPDKNSATIDLAELFGLSGSEAISGWLSVVSDNARVVGAVELFALDKAMSAYPLVSSSGADFHFAHLIQGNGFATGLALVNYNTQAAQLMIDVFDAGGALVATRKITLPPNSRLSDLVSSIFGLDSQVGGRIRVRSDIPIGGLEFFFNTDLTTLSVVPPQTIQ